MVERDADRPIEETAGLHDGLAHPTRVAILQVLREAGGLPVADLRRRLGETHREVDTRTVQHHLYKMQMAGLVSLRREDGTDVVRLLRDVALVVRPVHGRA